MPVIVDFPGSLVKIEANLPAPVAHTLRGNLMSVLPYTKTASPGSERVDKSGPGVDEMSGDLFDAASASSRNID
jgi:hypothetical protein